MVTGPIFAKYRLKTKAISDLCVPKKQLSSVTKNLETRRVLGYDRKKRDVLGPTATLVKEFFLQDVNSCPSAGKRETITRSKDKRQKRYLCDTMLNLYTKFQSENPRNRVSYTSFTRLRPFYVVPASVHGRDTVKCRMHCNIELKASKLHAAGILNSCNPVDVISSVVCSMNEQDCMYRTCQQCKDNLKNIYKDEGKHSSSEDIIRYFEWENTSEVRKTAKGDIKINVVSKVEKQDSVKNLCQVFEKDLVKLMPHQYRITHQYVAVKTIKTKMACDECVLQVDFSENYSCKAATEIQAMHFGGSRKQISLHTCHATMKQKDGKLYTKCFCTLSEDPRHNPAAIWAHLDPVVHELKSEHGIKTIHFVSDGPTTQYRNKTNFLLMSTIPFDNWNLQSITWNLLEASHGKCPADGVGAAVKSAADRLVANGADILSCRQLLSSLNDNLKNVKLYEIATNEIDAIMDEIAKSPPSETIRGTMQIHQILVPSRGRYYHRKLSCYCSHDTYRASNQFCHCHSPTEVITKPVLKDDPVLSGISAKLTAEQQKLFEKRFEEGYDVQIIDLSNLSPDKRQDYIYWKAYRAAKLQSIQKNATGNSVLDSGLEETNHESDENNQDSDANNHDSDWELCDTEESNELASPRSYSPNHACPDMRMDSYYAVFFLMGRTKLFYIGRAIENVTTNTVRFKFLEKKLEGSKFVYDWPRRNDYWTVAKHDVLEEVSFHGPPPFILEKKTI